MAFSPQLAKFIKEALGKKGGEVLLLVLSLLGLYFFAYRRGQFFRVPSGSMEPTLLIGDQIVTMREPVYKRGDIVVLRDPEDPKSFLVKRIAALSGETVLVMGGALYINGCYVSEPYINEPLYYVMEPFTVPEESVFVLGDNRNDSDDSHLWAQKSIPLHEIVGKVRYIYFPYDRAGSVPEHSPTIAKVISFHKYASNAS